MSLHTVTAIVKWVLEVDEKNNSFLSEFSEIPFEKRIENPKLMAVIKTMKNKWSSGNKIERMAVIGWDDKESLQILANAIEQLPTLRTEYQQNIRELGFPTEMNYEQYIEAVNSIENPKQ